MDSNKEIESWFPNIIGKPYKIINELNFEENEFNCVAFTLNIYDTYVWTNEKSCHMIKFLEILELLCLKNYMIKK